MKMSDAPTTEAEIEIAAPAERVWEIISDLQTPAQTSPEFKGAEWLDGATEPDVGARFLGRNYHEALGDWETTSTVMAADKPRELAWSVLDETGTPGSLWTYQITPVGDSAVRLKQIGQIGPGRNGLSLAIDRMPDKEEKIIRRRLGEHHAAIEANLAKIKELAEAAAE